MSDAQQSDKRTVADQRMGATVGAPRALVYRPVQPSAAARIAQMPSWAGCSEKTVRQTLLLVVRRTTDALQVLGEMGLETRVAEVIAMIDDAIGPRDVLPLSEALKRAEEADAEEQLAEAQLRFERECGTTSRATLERYIRASAAESYAAERVRQACRAELATLEATR